MKDRFEFIKDYYFRELNRRNEINGSLSVPIGLITALTGGVSYLLTNFDYHVKFWLTLLFVVATAGGLIFLICAIYNLIIAYSNYPHPYRYYLIADLDEIEKYRVDMQEFYKANPEKPDNSEKEWENYIISEMVKNTGLNQRNNKRKYRFSYLCEKYLIRALISISCSVPFYSINYGLKPDRKPSFNARIVGPGAVEIIQNQK